MNSHTDFPRTKDTENTSPWWNTPKFHLEWLRDFHSLEAVFIQIINWDLELLHKYRSLLYSAWYQSISMLNREDFMQHLREIQEWYHYQHLFKTIDNFIRWSIKYPEEHNWYDSFLAKNKAFDIALHIFYYNHNEIEKTPYSNSNKILALTLQKISEKIFLVIK